MNCDRCADLREDIPIRTPHDLKQALRVVRDNLADDTIRAVAGSLPPDDSIGDGIDCTFACSACGHEFRLGLGPDGKGGGSWRHQPGLAARKADAAAQRAARIASFPARGAVAAVTRADLRRRIGAGADEPLKLARPCVQLEPWPCAARDLGPGRSRIGGEPYLPDGFAWPEFRGEPLDFIAQIFLDELPAGVLPALPQDGVLSFFYAVGENPWDGEKGGGRVFHHAAADLVRFDSDAPDEEMPGPHGITFVPGLTLPDDAEHALVVDHHLGGHAELLQDDGPGKGWQLLLQLGGDSHPLGLPWDGEGRLYFWMKDKDLAAGKFDRCTYTFQAT